MLPIQSSVANLYGLNAKNGARARSLSNIERAAQKNANKDDVANKKTASNSSSYNLDISDAGRKALSEQISVKKNDNEESGGAKLSKKAEQFLEKLKEKYKDYDLFVAEDLDAEDATAGATKKYSVIFKPEELEKMANDEEYADKVMGKVDEAIGITKNIEEKGELGEGVSFKKISIKIDEEGNMKMFAELEKMSEAQMKRMEDLKAKRAEEKEAAEKANKADENEKEADEEPEEPLKVKTAKIEASSEEELLEMIKGINWDEIEEK